MWAPTLPLGQARDTARAMSQENVEIIRRGYEALNRRDVDTWLNGFHADAEVHDLPTIPDAPVYRGHYALRNWVEMIRDVWTEESYYELEKLTAAGDFVLVAVRAHAWGRGSGVPIEVSFFQVFEMRDRKVQRAWAYFDEDEALEAAGLRE
jgi:ketosteroid isomerase-like protein